LSRRASTAVIAWVLAAAHAPSAASAEIIDRVRATVGGHRILASDVAAARTFGLVDVEGAADPDAEALSRLIDRILVLTEVIRYAPPEPEDRAVTRELETVRARFDGPDAFSAALARVGLEETHLREWLRQDLRALAYLDQRFVVTQPSEEEIAAAYGRDAARWARQGARLPLEDVRPAIVRALVSERRAARVEEWLSGLRRRTAIVTRP
jgi:hypothetical protein